ncbi:zinc finger protein 2 [Seiridium cupressi]
MAAHMEPRHVHALGSTNAARTLLSAPPETVRRMAPENPGSSNMAPHLTSRAAIAARSDMSGGAIAGAVIGSIIGVTLISVVVGFLYFRWKRSQSLPAEEDKPIETDRRLSVPDPEQTTGQPQLTQGAYAQPWIGNAQFERGGPVWTQSMDAPQHFPPEDGRPVADAADPFQAPSQANYPSQSLDGQDFDGQTEYVPPATVIDGGAASYYDTTIAMDSDPEQIPSAPTRQMTELYEEQLRKSRHSRKNSKGSTWSRLTKGFMPKRKRSTRVSEIAMEEGKVRPSLSTSHPDVALYSIEGEGANQARGFGPDTELFEEPQEMSDSSHFDTHGHKRAKRRGPSGDTSGQVPHRLDSMQTQPTLDSQLPSAALLHKPTPSDKAVARQATRFQSPDLPEPMEIDKNDLVGRDRTSVVRGSNSPPLEGAGFSAVNPMDIMRPSNAAEKAVYTNAELIRIASTSVSPPTSPPYSAESPSVTHATDHVAGHDLEDADHADESDYDEDEDEDEVEEAGYQEAPQIAIDEAFLTDGPSDWSTPAGTTSTDPSTGRTPGTDITSSPSPAPSNTMLKTDSSVSPPDSAGSPRPVLTCEECGRKFDQIHKLNHHKRYHDRRHVCPYQDCGKKFGTKTHLDRHINDKHEKKQGFHCTQESCQYFIGGKSFPRKDNWRRHMVNKHGINPTVEPLPVR